VVICPGGAVLVGGIVGGRNVSHTIAVLVLFRRVSLARFPPQTWGLGSHLRRGRMPP
jgi:hypothetical protein